MRFISSKSKQYELDVFSFRWRIQMLFFLITLSWRLVSNRPKASAGCNQLKRVRGTEHQTLPGEIRKMFVLQLSTSSACRFYLAVFGKALVRLPVINDLSSASLLSDLAEKHVHVPWSEFKGKCYFDLVSGITLTMQFYQMIPSCLCL